MKKLWIAAPVLLALTYAGPVLAQGKLKAEGFYIGGAAGVGVAKLDFNEINLLDNTSLAWKGIVGFRGRNVAVEFDYRSLQEGRTVIPGSEITSRVKGFTGSLLLILPAGPVDIYGRGGYFRATTTLGIGDDITETKEWALVYGAGLALRIGSFALRAEYERPKLDQLTTLHQLSAGFTVAF